MSVSTNILAVVILYRQKLEETNTWQTLLHCWPSEAIYVHDNTHDNLGLSKAYNIAARYAQLHRFDWILLLDQDTRFPADAAEVYHHLPIEHPDVHLFAPIHKVHDGRYMSPTPYRMKVSSLQNGVRTGLVNFSYSQPVNSGMMVRIDDFFKAGGYSDEVLLDFSDVCFIERFRQYYKEYWVEERLLCEQSFSALEADPESIHHRMKLYLKSAKAFPCGSLWERVQLTLTTLRPVMSRTLRERTMVYLNMFFTYYLSKRE